MLETYLPLAPVAWKRPGNHKGRRFDAQAKTKDEWNHALVGLFPNIETSKAKLKVTMHFFIAMPKSWSKAKQREMFHERHSSRPDLSNLVKFLEDAFNGSIWEDDSQIVEIHCMKQWAEEGSIYLKVEEI